LKLTRAGEYAIRCVLYLSQNYHESVVSRREIAETMEIPVQFLGKIAQQLAHANIMEITQGAKGGYRLLRDPQSISLLEVVEAVDGPIFLNQCVLRPDSCHRSPLCAVHTVWEEARNQLRNVLGNANFAQLSRSDTCEILSRSFTASTYSD